MRDRSSVAVDAEGSTDADHRRDAGGGLHRGRPLEERQMAKSAAKEGLIALSEQGLPDCRRAQRGPALLACYSDSVR